VRRPAGHGRVQSGLAASNIRAKLAFRMVDFRPMADDIGRILSADAEDDGDVVIEGTLRPRTLTEYIGQREVKANLSVLLAAARGRGEDRRCN